MSTIEVPIEPESKESNHSLQNPMQSSTSTSPDHCHPSGVKESLASVTTESKSIPNTTRNVERRPSNSKSHQKNDKPVEVCHDNKVIARFKTQTECARYLRATPEAVSYHCGKGGGVCNGLLVRPVVTTSSSTEGSVSPRLDVYFGLFDGSSTHRPPARPQLSTEVVSTLKAWLLSPEHIDNPYPSGSDFDALMETTKLDKSQLKHWFNNARKRIWKPLVKSEGRLIPKFGKIGKRRMSGGAKRGFDANSDDEDEDGTDFPDASSSILSTTTTTTGGKRGTISKRRKSDDTPATTLAGGGTAGLASALNMCHSIGAQELFQRRESDDSQYESNNNINNNNFNMLMMNRYNQIFGNMGMFSQGNNGGLPMMGGNSMMNSSFMNHPMRMMDSAAGTLHNNSISSSNSYLGMGFQNNSGGSSFIGRDGGFSSFQGCMEVNDGAPNIGGMRNANGQELQYNSSGNSMSYCQPLIQTNPQGLHKKKSSVHSATLIESVRSNAVFKQQVASMAMNEASTSFKEMEDAFARSKEILAQVREENNNSDQHSSPEEDDVRVMEANAHAKSCQNTAMFKLKVSQRASEEAASAYDCYLRLVEDNDSMI
jgi:hypothetical protein